MSMRTAALAEGPGPTGVAGGKALRVLFVTPTLAATRFLGPLLARLCDLGHEVHYASAGFAFAGADGLDPRVVSHRLALPRGASPAGHLAAARALRGLFDALRPDVVDVHYSAAMLTAALALGRAAGPPTVATVHGLRFTALAGARARLEAVVETWAARRMDRVFVLTEDDRRAFASRGIGHVRVQPSAGVGCDLARFDPTRFTEGRRREARRRLGVPEGARAVAFVGRFVAFKGFDVAVAAFERAARSVPSLHLVLCGVYDPVHPSGLDAGRRRALAADPRVSMPGWTEEVEEVLAISEACLFPSVREGMPVNLMEALAMGVPVVTADARGCRDIVTDGVDGLVVAPRDVPGTAAALHRLVTDGALRARLGAGALAGRARFDAARFVDARVAELVEVACAPRGARPPRGTGEGAR